MNLVIFFLMSFLALAEVPKKKGTSRLSDYFESIGNESEGLNSEKLIKELKEQRKNLKKKRTKERE